MKSKLDAPYFALITAIGLEFGCAGRTSFGEDDENGTDVDGDSSDSPTDEGESGESVGTEDGESGTDTGDPYQCEDPTPIMQAGTDTPSGFVMCADGFVHRAEKVECLAPQAQDDPICVGGTFGCTSAADCLVDTFGSCVEDVLGGGCLCQFGCATDDDCDRGQICACAGVVGDAATCISAACTITDECGDGLCGLSSFEGCCDTSHATVCAAPDAPCHVDAECTEFCFSEPSTPQTCTAQGESGLTGWNCQDPGWCGCDCGRPFMVDGAARSAGAVSRSDWREPTAPLARPDAATCARLARYWTDIGRLEHASIASFARAGAELLQLGAPPQLLADTATAMHDEVRHARIAFGLASAYSGTPIGPGRLAVGHTLAHTDVRAIVEGLIAEACVGETLAAIEVREAARHARDPVVAAILDRIADDELRHAQLGWRCLRWILDQADARVRHFAWTRFEATLAALTPAGSCSGDTSLRAHGVLDEALRAEVRRAAIESVIRPCAIALRSTQAGVSPIASSIRNSIFPLATS